MCVPCKWTPGVCSGVCEVRQGNASHLRVKWTLSFLPSSSSPPSQLRWHPFLEPAGCGLSGLGVSAGDRSPAGRGGGRLPLGTSCLSSPPHGRPHIQAYGEEGEASW